MTDWLHDCRRLVGSPDTASLVVIGSGWLLDLSATSLRKVNTGGSRLGPKSVGAGVMGWLMAGFFLVLAALAVLPKLVTRGRQYSEEVVSFSIHAKRSSRDRLAVIECKIAKPTGETLRDPQPAPEQPPPEGLSPDFLQNKRADESDVFEDPDAATILNRSSFRLRKKEFLIARSRRDTRLAGPVPEYANLPNDPGYADFFPGTDLVFGAERPNEGCKRTIDADLIAPKFETGAIATLTVTLRLPTSTALGGFQGEANIRANDSPVTVLLSTKGFTVLSEPPQPLMLTPNRDSAPAAFQIRIEAAASRWLHIMLFQAGQAVGELTINDFTTFNRRYEASTPMLRACEADLTLIMRSSEEKITVSSPRNRASLDHVTMDGLRPLATPFRAMLQNRLRGLYDAKADAAEAARELQIVGVELARCLSKDLTELLRKDYVQTIMLRHDEDFEFPLELCFIDDEKDPFFVGDRIAVCRWYLGVTNPADVVEKRVQRVAFMRGSDIAAAADEQILRAFYPTTTSLATMSEVRDQLFKTRDFDLIHFTGHCRVADDGLGGLLLADGSFVRLIDVGQLIAERRFAEARPFVLLNACASAQPYVGLTDKDSFAHRFVSAEACAFVGTLWPVAGTVANEFAEAFYGALRTEPIGRALLEAKRIVVRRAALAADPDIAAVARQVAARSYCLFAHPDLRVAT